MSYGAGTLDARHKGVDVDALLARRLRAGSRRQAESAGIPRRGSSDPALLSFAQQRLWFLDQMEPGTPLYNVPYAVRLAGSLDLRALERAFTEVIRRHETLRTTFGSVEATPVQEVSAPRPFRLTIIDLQRRPAAELDQELGWRLTAEAQRPFNLQRDLMLRATVFHLAPGEHVLLVTMHHIASDAWSIGILMNELARLYNAFLEGKSSPLPELPIQYADFAIWQRQAVSGALLEKQLSYWRAKLADAPENIDLPSDSSGNMTSPSHRGVTRSIILPSALAANLHKASQSSGVTLFMFLLTGFKILLHRYSGQADIVVGSPAAGRGRVETEPLIGFFLNTLVLRTNFNSRAPVGDALTNVRNVCLEAFSHQDLPFDKLVQELQPGRHANRTPLFQVMFTLQSATVPTASFRVLSSEPIEVELGVSPFDLTLFTEETTQGLTAAIEYKADLFEAGTIDRMLASFRVLLEGMAADPQKRISELKLLSPSNERQLLQQWNGPGVDLQADRCVHEMIAEQAARTANAVAITFGQRQLTYGQLEDKAERLADRLRHLGAGPETLVGVCLERSLDMIVGLVAVLKASAAYVPLDPTEPTERLAFKLKDSGARIVLTQHRLRQSIPDSTAPTIICLDEDRPDSAKPDGRAPESKPANLANAAYVIYTSGSTGTPKGVVIEHAALANHCRGFAKRFKLETTDRVLQFAPLSFDVSVEEIFPSLISGSTLVLRPDLLSISIADLNSFLVKEGLTVVNLPTPYWYEWLQEMERSGTNLPASVRTVIVGSDTVTVDQFRLWQRLTQGRVQWCNAYGITEATITSTVYEPSRGDAIRDRVPIGRPAPNVCIYILDSAGQPVPVGVRGDLYIGGAEPARGYLNRPDLTPQKFLADPFSSKPGARMVRTGDLARWRADGNVEFLGRADDQVKIRGFRIELGEIESSLLQHPSVREAIVLAREFSGEKCLVAYVIPQGGTPLSVSVVREYLKSKLPAYMIPSAIVELKALPLLPNGKVDRRALPAPGAAHRELPELFTPATDALEKQLARIWADVLRVQIVGIHDNFFDLGGHSLLAVKLGREIEKLTGRNLPLVHLFQSPTIAQLAKLLRDEDVSSNQSLLLPIQASGSRPPLVLVHGAGGGMLWGYANLARYLPGDQPVYAFNSRGMNGEEEHSTVEKIASSYVEELLQFQPKGPFYLGGYCFGGELAFEVAQQLHARGHEVGLLALFNAFPPNSSFERLRLTPLSLARFALNTCRWLNYFRKWTPEQRRDFLKRKLGLVRKSLQLRKAHRAQTVDDIHAEDFIDVSEYADYQRHLWDVHLRASARYMPRSYAGHITVFRTGIHPFLCSFDPSFGWTEFANGGCIVKVVTGAHESILDEPYVRALAKELDKCLMTAQQRSLDDRNSHNARP